MVERFNDQARMVMALANQEAHRWNHEGVFTEHILLGLLCAPASEGAMVLAGMGVELSGLQREVESAMTRGPNTESPESLPQTPQIKAMLGWAIDESKALGHDYIGSEHLLLGMVREESGLAGRVLRDRGVDLVRARVAVGAGRPAKIATGKPPLSEEALDVVGRGIHAARALGHSPVEPGHLLLGLLLHGKGVTAEILTRHGVTIEDVQAQLLKWSQRGDRGRRG